MNEIELREALAAALDKYEVAKKDKNKEEARKASDEVRELREELDMEMTVRANSLPALGNAKPVTKGEQESRSVSELTEDEAEKEYTKVFLKAVRKSNLSQRDTEIFDRIRELRDAPSASPYLNSNVDENGGLLIPKDVQTKINEYKRAAAFELQSLVTTQTVSMRSGSRVFEKLAQSTPWVPIDEWETIPEVAAPTFEQKTYAIKDYAGILPIPNRMLQDTDAALMETIAKFIARKSIITRNSVILGLIESIYSDRTVLKDIDDVKDVLNVTLDPVFASSAKIVTNQDGFNLLDKMKDNDGKYLLQADVTSPTGKSLLGKQVVLIPNRELPSTETAAPVLMGDLAEAITFFDRGVYEIKGTDVGGNSFTRNSYDIRVIDRFDVQAWDTAAVVAGELTLPTAP